jgi:anti-sigma-K factor RskA
LSGVDPTEYLLGELGPEEMARGRSLEQTDAAFRAEVELLRPVVASLEALPGEAWDPPAPPPFASLGITDTKRSGLSSPRRNRWPALITLRPAMGLAAAVALLVAGGLAGALVGGDSSPPQESAGTNVVLASLKSAEVPPHGAATLARDRSGLSVDVSDLPANRDGSFYGVWLLNTDGTMVSLGGFQVDGRGHAELDVPVPVDPSKYQFVDISLEPGDGNPRHSGDSILRGPVT